MSEADRAMWRELLSAVQRDHPAVSRHWFTDLELSTISNGTIEIVAPTRAQAEYLRREGQRVFAEAALEATGRLMTVRFVTEPSAPSGAAASGALNGSASGAGAVGGAEAALMNGVSRAPSAPASGREASRGSLDELTVSPDYTFDTFIVGPNNRLAHAAAQATVDAPGTAYNPLFIHGGVGLGKTHLLQAICQGIQTQRPGSRLLYISCEGFITRFIECVQGGKMDDFRHQFRDVDLLMIDDVHFLAKRDRTQDEFFHTFNSLYQSQRQIVLSSDAPPDQIPDLEERLVSRFQWGMVAPIEPPAYETRVEIVKNKARVRGAEISDEAAGFIAARYDSNIRELEGALTKVQMQARLDGTALDLATAQAALGSEPAEAAPVTLESVVNAVTGYYEVSLSSLQSKKRQRSIALPRQICMYLARQHTRYSLEEIGGYFGGRDHSTVLHAVRTVEKHRREDDSVDSAVRKLETDLARR